MGGWGTILATSDGGATWIKQRSGTGGEDLVGVAFPDATHGWAVGNGGLILATTDGGATWITQGAGNGVGFHAVAFSDATHGWAVGAGGAILATTNGGTTWSAQTSGISATLYGVAFADSTHGWAAGQNGSIIATTNGGLSPAPAGAPKIVKLKPPSGKRGATVVISGTNFGAAQGTSAVKFGSKTCTTYVSWSDAQITCNVPAKAKYGAVKVTVTTTAGKSNGKSFKVKR